MKYKRFLSVLSSVAISTGFIGCGVVPVLTAHQQQRDALVGYVFFSGVSWQVKNVAIIRSHATVSLLYPAEHATDAHRTAAAGSTDANGAFQLTFDSSFTPAVGDMFILEASRRMGPAQQRQALRTWVRRTANGWESLTGDTTVVDARTTALSALIHLKSLTASDFIAALTLSAGETSYPETVGDIASSEVEEATALAHTLLSESEDPVAVLARHNTQILPARVTNPQSQILQDVLHCPFCDLAGADLQGLILNGANLNGANLQYADLHNASLIDANLQGAALRGTRLGGVTWLNGIACEPESVGACQQEFQVNTYTLGSQRNPHIASDREGNFVAVWQDESGQDGSDFGIYARRFDAHGIPRGPQFQVNTFTVGGQGGPDVAMAPDGSFVIVWQSANDEPSSEGIEIIAQRYDSTGTQVGGPFRANTFQTGNQHLPRMSMDHLGNVVIVWRCSSRQAIIAQRYNADMQPIGSEIQVNQLNRGQPQWPSVSVGPQGGFVVAWEDLDGSDLGVFARAFDTQGISLTDDIQLNQHTAKLQGDVEVAMDQSGKFVATWHSYYQDEGGIDSVPGQTGAGIYMRRFQANGTPLSDEVRVNTTVFSMQMYPAIAIAPEGHFAISWDSYGQDDANEIAGSGVYLQRFTAQGAPLGREQQVNTYTLSHQGSSTLSWGGNGNLHLAWTSVNQEPVNPDDPGPVLVGIFGKQIGFWP